MKKKLEIPEAELEIMQIIWEHGGCIMFSELSAELARKQKDWKSNTVLTFLTRLAARDMITVTKQGRLNQYTALITESEYLETQTHCFVNKVFGGDAKHLVSALIKQDYFTEEDYEELKNFWNGGCDGT